MSEEIIIEDPHKFGERLWILKKQDIFCDATITVKKERFSVHAVVLASRSRFFEKTFDLERNNRKNISFHDFDRKAVLSVIEYCYKGTIKINEKNAHNVLKLAILLSIPKIAEGCLNVLKKLMTSENCLAMWKTAKLANSETLTFAIVKFIRDNYREVIRSPDFLSLIFRDLIEIIQSRLNNVPEMLVYEAVKEWIYFDALRTENIDDILDHIKLEFLPHDFLLTESRSICNSNGPSLLKFISAMERQRDSMLLNISNPDTLLAVGHFEDDLTKTIDIFDKTKLEWIEIDFDHCERRQFSSVLINDKLLMIGGLSNGCDLNLVEYYYLKTGRIETLPSMNSKRIKPATAKFEEHVYVLGGFDNGAPLASVEKWDPSSKTWQDVAPMSSPRYGLGVAVFGNEIFAIGGRNGDLSSSEVEAYDPEKNTWRSCNPMNEERGFHGVAVVGDYLYVAGGRNDKRLLTVERYDPKIDKWTYIQSMQNIRSGVGVVDLNGQLIIAGGYLGDEHQNTIEAYDEKTDRWKPLPFMNKPRVLFDLISVPWTLAKYVISRKKSK